MRSNEIWDAAIVGAGPAGATAALLLASWGRSVIVVGRADLRPALAESIPPSCRRLFAFLGLLDAVDRAGFFRSSGNTSWWGETAEHVERFPGTAAERGYQVDRRAFDRLLADLAASAGARVAREGAVEFVDLDHEEEARLFLAAGGAPVRARYALDCSGRAGVIARQGLRLREPAYATLAIATVWKRDGPWPDADPSHTLVESYRDGWAWSVPLSERTRCVAVMIDAARARAAPELDRLYRSELAEARHFARLLRGCEPVSSPWGCDASLYTARAFAGPRFFLVGDAASFIDPLSSFGIKKALASAHAAAAAVHTCLDEPEMHEAAALLHSAREREVYASYLRQTAGYFTEAERAHPTEFWRARAASGACGRADDAWQIDETELARDPEVLAAFEALKRCRSIRLETSGGVRIEKRPVLAARRIVLEETIAAPGSPAGLRYLGGVDLPKLVAVAPRHRQVPDLFEAYNRIAPPIELENFLGALSVLLAKGILRNTEHA